MKVTIAERIQLHKLGYSREDIDALIAEPETAEPELLPVEPAAAAPAAEPTAIDNSAAVLSALQGISTQLQQMAIMNSSNPPANPEQSTFDILNSFINNNKGGQ